MRSLLKISIKTNPKLWESLKKKLLKKNSNKWSARLAQQLVQLYKKKGGKFKGSRANLKYNSLRKWTKEDWGYNGRYKKSRYLPKKLRNILKKNKQLSYYENKKKHKHLGSRIKYSKKLLQLFNKHIKY